MESAKGIDSDRPNRDLFVFEQPAADEHDLAPRVARQGCRDRRRVGDDDAVPSRRKSTRNLDSGRSAIDHKRSSRFQKWDTCLGQRDLRLWRNLQAALERQNLRSRGQGTAMNPLEKPQPRQFVEIATDRVLRNAQAGHELGDHDSAVALESSKDFVSAFSDQHLCGL